MDVDVHSKVDLCISYENIFEPRKNRFLLIFNTKLRVFILHALHGLWRMTDSLEIFSLKIKKFISDPFEMRFTFKDIFILDAQFVLKRVIYLYLYVNQNLFCVIKCHNFFWCECLTTIFHYELLRAGNCSGCDRMFSFAKKSIGKSCLEKCLWCINRRSSGDWLLLNRI